MTRDINKEEFSEQTQLKLDIFRECFREWFPVFLYDRGVKGIYIYDMFAGSGNDAVGNSGSPIIILEEAKGKTKTSCKSIITSGKNVKFIFNEKAPCKNKNLEYRIDSFFDKCKQNCDLDDCVLKNKCFCPGKDFKEVFQRINFQKVLKNNSIAKFIILDQYGFSQITDEVFRNLIASPKTDFIFFIASSFVKRFKTETPVIKYFGQNSIHFDESDPAACHQAIVNYYKSLIPKDIDYFLHGFTIKNNTNYYGLVFGTSHSLGMEKFLRVCWKHDNLAGESNCNLYNDYSEMELFYNPNKSNKKQIVREEIKKEILYGRISNNYTGLVYALRHGCLPRLFVDVVKNMRDEGLIKIEGKFNEIATKVHTIKTRIDKQYKIVVC